MSKSPACLAADYGSTIPTGAAGHLTGQKPLHPATAAALRALRDDLALRIVLTGRHSATRVLRAWAVLADAAARDFPRGFCLPGGIVVPRESREPRS